MSRSHRQIVKLKQRPRGTSVMDLLPYNKNTSYQDKNFNFLLQKGRQLYFKQMFLPAIEIFKRGLYFQSHHTQINIKLAICYYSLGKYDIGLEYLQFITQQGFDNHLLLAIGYAKINKRQTALKQINKHIKQYPDDLRALFFRAKLLFQQQSYQQGLEDIKKCIIQQPHNYSYILLNIRYLQSLKLFEQTQKYILGLLSQHFDKINIQKLQIQLLQLYLNIKKYQKCQQRIKYIQQNITNFSPKINIIKSKILQKQNKSQQCLMILNQILSNSHPNHIFNQALAQCALTCMIDRDFYQAFMYLKRSTLVQIKCTTNQNLLKLTQGVTFLMKKKFPQALVLLGSCQLNLKYTLKQDIIYLNNLLNNAIAFGHFNLAQHAQALFYYKRINQQQINTDKSSIRYNIFILQGILQYKSNNYFQAQKYFQQAFSQLRRPQPYFYMASLLSQQSLKQPSQTTGFIKVLELLEKGLNVGQSAHMHYFRSLVYLYLGMNEQALQQIDKAIQKSEDNIAIYFHVRGVIFMIDKNYEQAISQFTTSLSIDQLSELSFLQRAKCHLLLGQNQQGYKDLYNTNKYQQYQAIFLMFQKQYSRAISQGQLSIQYQEICQFMEGRFQNSGAAGKLMLAIKFKKYSQVIQIIEEAKSLQVGVGCVCERDLQLIKAFCAYSLQMYEECLITLTKLQYDLKQIAREQAYNEHQQKRLLITKINIILVHLKKGHHIQALGLLEHLMGQICQGPIFSTLNQMKKCINQKNIYSLDLPIQCLMLSDYFPEQKLNDLNFTFRFLIPMPNPKLKQVQTPLYQQLLYNFTVLNVDDRPQAPWIKRGEYGVIFTNQIQQFNNLNLKTQQSQLKQKIDSHTYLKKAELAETLKLSNSVLEKLDRLTKKKQQ